MRTTHGGGRRWSAMALPASQAPLKQGMSWSVLGSRKPCLSNGSTRTDKAWPEGPSCCLTRDRERLADRHCLVGSGVHPTTVTTRCSAPTQHGFWGRFERSPRSGPLLMQHPTAQATVWIRAVRLCRVLCSTSSVASRPVTGGPEVERRPFRRYDSQLLAGPCTP